MHDHNSLTEVMKAGFTQLFLDFSALTGYSFDLDASRIKSFHDYTEILSYLSKHEAVLLSYFKTGRLDPRAVKHCGAGVPVFLRDLWGLLLQSDASLRIQGVSLLRQCFALWKKAEVSVDSGPDIEKFVARQNAPRLISVPWLGLVDAMASCWGRAVGGPTEDLRADALVPYTSSGATYEKTPVLDRVEAIEDLVSLRHNGFLSYVPKVRTVARNRAVAVPKDWTKTRIVFVEPSPRMQAQQCLRRWLESAVDRSFLKKRVNFRDQGFQRRSLAQDGRSSIDLSDASDYVRSCLVWRFFRLTPVLRSALFGSRSRTCETPLGETPLHSYSTMGNATTFTVMSIILSCLLEVAERDVYLKTGYQSRPGTVFGDDIVCDDVIAGTVLEYLDLLGLKPNPRKTFISSAFRESCGLDLFEGSDVTPVAVKRWKSDTDEDISARVAYSNALWRRGLWRTAVFLSQREDVPVNTSARDDSYFSFSEGWDGRWSRWLADEQRYVWALRAPHDDMYERDSECHLQYALVNGRLRASEDGNLFEDLIE